jgi:hypothetical protein
MPTELRRQAPIGGSAEAAHNSIGGATRMEACRHLRLLRQRGGTSGGRRRDARGIRCLWLARFWGAGRPNRPAPLRFTAFGSAEPLSQSSNPFASGSFRRRRGIAAAFGLLAGRGGGRFTSRAEIPTAWPISTVRRNGPRSLFESVLSGVRPESWGLRSNSRPKLSNSRALSVHGSGW